MRGRIAQAFDEVVGIARLNDREAAAAIRDRKISLLINLNGYFGRERQGLFSHRPCPVQVNYLGYPGTLGAPYIDYILADRWVIPPEHDAFYTEKVVRLPDSYQVNDRKRAIAERSPARPELGLPDEGFVFCCFNNSYKITPRDLRRLDAPAARRCRAACSGCWKAIRGTAQSAARGAARGVAPERLVFAPRMDLAGAPGAPPAADLFLDTLPYNAHTTASDALWAGLPVLTCMGDDVRRPRGGKPAPRRQDCRSSSPKRSTTTRRWRSARQRLRTCSPASARSSRAIARRTRCSTRNASAATSSPLTSRCGSAASAASRRRASRFRQEPSAQKPAWLRGKSVGGLGMFATYA